MRMADSGNPRHLLATGLQQPSWRPRLHLQELDGVCEDSNTFFHLPFTLYFFPYVSSFGCIDSFLCWLRVQAECGLEISGCCFSLHGWGLYQECAVGGFFLVCCIWFSTTMGEFLGSESYSFSLLPDICFTHFSFHLFLKLFLQAVGRPQDLVFVPFVNLYPSFIFHFLRARCNNNNIITNLFAEINRSTKHTPTSTSPAPPPPYSTKSPHAHPQKSTSASTSPPSPHSPPH